MDNRIREALVDLFLAILKGLKVLVIYILPAAFSALLVSSELREALENRPELVGLVPVINVLFVTIAELIKQRAPKDSSIQKIL